MQIFIHRGGKQYGPYTQDQIQDFLADGSVVGEDECLVDEDTQLSPLRARLQHLFPASAFVAELPPEPIHPPPIPVPSLAPALHTETPSINEEGTRPSLNTLDVNCIKRRVGAAAVDAFLFGLLAIPIFWGLNYSWSSLDLRIVLCISLLVLFPVIAFVLSSEYQGTLGMTLCGIALGNEKGERVAFRQAFIRHVASIPSYFFFLGFLLCSRNQQKKTLHDVLTRTVVFRKNFDSRAKFYQGLMMMTFLGASILSGGILVIATKPNSFRDGQAAVSRITQSFLSIFARNTVRPSTETAINQATPSTNLPQTPQNDANSVPSAPGDLTTPSPNLPQTPQSDANSEPSAPGDPGDKIMYKKRFKILQIISPGRALAQETITYNITESEDGDKVYLLVGIPADLVDADSWSGWVFVGDNYTYATTDNASKTVRSFVVSTNQSPKTVKVDRKVEMEDGSPHLIDTITGYP